MISSTKGNRKLIALAIVCLTLVSISITLIIVQPPGLNILDFFTWAGGVLATLKALFVGGNAMEHRAASSQAPPPPPSSPPSEG